MKKKKTFLWLIVIAIIIVLLCAFFGFRQDKRELKSIKSKAELMRIYNGDNYEDNIFVRLLTMPFSLVYGARISVSSYGMIDDVKSVTNEATSTIQSLDSSITEALSKDYSTTNIQVENVDEADITKTDGDYIYSISGNEVIITDVRDEKSIKIASRLSINEDDYIPDDLILYGNKLVVISTYYMNYNNSNTMVSIYDITNKEDPKIKEEFKLYEEYYTSRCIEGKLLIIASGVLRRENNEIITYYEENNNKKEIGLSNIRYLEDIKSRNQTLIASYDLNTEENVKINSYLFDVENAYISQENMYLLENNYDWRYNNPDIKDLLGWGGIIGFLNDAYNRSYSYSYGEETHIYKFNINEDGTIKYSCKTNVRGSTINQFSLDEYKGNLRIGLYTYDGSRVAVFDKNLKLLGETNYLSKGERMYSTRFIGEKAYMVTYKNTDPLYVIDLSNPSDPTVLGKLKIPGYSTYLHPYDETHLIGIGMQTKENVYRDSSGKVTSTTAVITGMKMAIFDVSDVNNPKQISETLIGDSRTTSAILTNHKALLFSKEKGIIAIPVNNYAEDVEISASSTDISSMTDAYKNYYKSYISEGYFVYDINLTDGFKLKGTITHDKKTTTQYYTYRNTSKLLRGLWIDNNLYTVSEDMLKVNDLKTLEEKASLQISKSNATVLQNLQYLY